MLDKHEIGARRAAWLRDTAYVGNDKSKRMQADWDVSHATAERWLAGEMPGNAQLERELRRWGRPYVEFLFAPALGIVPAMGAPLLRVIANDRGADRRLDQQPIAVSA
jgi:hypothetical protein